MDGMATPAAASAPNRAQASRTLAITTGDDLRFMPATMRVAAGETIAFKITNTGTVPHEFVIGDELVQQAHEQEMLRGDSMSGMTADASYAVDVPAGKRATLSYTFGRAGTLLFGCHVPGHYGAGMRGVITITDK
jgi:uncharacterized cupredoxin-like copper-binding protein